MKIQPFKIGKNEKINSLKLAKIKNLSNLGCQKPLKIDIFYKLSLKISSNQRFYVNWTSNIVKTSLPQNCVKSQASN